jgi:putative hydrolase of the HAD superfamily
MPTRFFNKINFWVFDLDNTLYHPKLKIFDQIDQRMKSFISEKLNMSKEEAFKIQKKFYYKYGTTLFGLMKHYNVKPQEFLDFVHNIDLSRLKKCKNLFEKINKLPGEKIIYTNGDEKYASRVLNALGIINLFEDILDIKKCNYIPKPSVEALINLLKKKKVKYRNCVYFEDLEKNLVNAHKYGITTIHITNKNGREISTKPFIDFRFNSIIKALDVICKTIN